MWLLDFPTSVVQGSHFLMICLDSVRCDGGMTGRESPGWGRSWMCSLTLWRHLRGDKRIVSEGESGGSCTVKVSCTTHPYLSTRVTYSLLRCRRWGVVHVSGSWTNWFGSQRCCSSRGKDPTNPKNREVISTLADVSAITLGVKSKPPSVCICSLVTVWSSWFLAVVYFHQNKKRRKPRKGKVSR
jgi:hypothetical protein